MKNCTSLIGWRQLINISGDKNIDSDRHEQKPPEISGGFVIL
jgi:hypothetical protein